IGVIFFSDKIEKYIPPQKGKKHILYIIRELLSFQPTSRKTNIDFALKYFTNMVKKRCSAFLISDFIDDSNYSDSLLIASKKHDLAALQIFDPREKELPDAGLIKMKDAETNEDMWVDTSSASTRRVYEQYVKERDELLAQSFAKSGVDYISIATTDDYVKSLMKLFKKRA
ncbi:MAG: VWA domain-containing protein, partial [Paludibacteraceae bacterium]|nr:VWA domain-containing protein [Paludibacteraceae bacterium]